jgi:hypothetical protein
MAQIATIGRNYFNSTRNLLRANFPNETTRVGLDEKNPFIRGDFRKKRAMRQSTILRQNHESDLLQDEALVIFAHIDWCNVPLAPTLADAGPGRLPPAVQDENGVVPARCRKQISTEIVNNREKRNGNDAS